MKQIISITDITSYLYCPRKLWLKMQGVHEPANRKMILGMLKHKIFDVFNKNEPAIVSSLEKQEKKYIKNAYITTLVQIISEIYSSYKNMALSFEITREELEKSILKQMNTEIELRADSILDIMNKGFLGKELWRNLSPKYLTEFSLVNPVLGLKGRIDRIKIDESIVPYEIKTRPEIYESDKLQLAGYALLLENEFSKPIVRAIVEVEGNQEEIIIDDKLKSRVLEIADAIRNLKEPSFSSNFAKCEKCQLKEECFK